MISQDFVSMTRCPEDRSPLALAEADLVERLNRAIRAGRLTNRAHKPLTRPLDGGLIREDRTILYQIVDGFPILIVDEGILLDQLSESKIRNS